MIIFLILELSNVIMLYLFPGTKKGNGKMIFSNGNEVEGNWSRAGELSDGTMRFSNGDVYEGELENGERNGKGKMTYKDGEDILEQYEGDFQHGQYHGQGTLIDRYGEVLEGTFKENKYIKNK